MATIKEAKANTGTLCWRCHYAVNAEKPAVCCWAHHLEPRTDWDADRIDTSGGESYQVHECPLFLSDKDWAEQQKEEESEK